MDKKSLSERDICTKFVTPALIAAGWDQNTGFLEEVTFTDGKIYVRGKLSQRGKGKRADYILYHKTNIPIAVIEAKDNRHTVGDGMQQALDYAKILDVPCAFSTNGDAFLFHDRSNNTPEIETELEMGSFPAPEALWERYKVYKNIYTEEQERISSQDYFFDSSGKRPRYYQQNAINRTVEAVSKGTNRILLVMATGTGKTYVAFQIAYRLWKARVKKRILFLADRNILIDQARRNDFKHFSNKMTVVKKRQVDKSYEIYLALYQGLTGNEEVYNVYKQFTPEFFDLVIVDECHRGSAKDDSAWREILTYFSKATHIGLTATPKETDDVSNSEYFGTPLYTYSLRQGIDDGFLAPYSVIRVGLNVDLEGYRPERGKTDVQGDEVPDRIYNRKDFDRNLIIDERTEVVAKKITEFLKGFDRYAKTIVFCVDIDHAERMRSALVRENHDLVIENEKYIMRITGDNDEGKRELDNFIDPEQRFPVIATTSELMTTGVDAQTCKLIVLDSNIMSMTKFKQIIGRGTRINEEYNKFFFTILDFRNATDRFADKGFDGDPIRIKPVLQDADLGLLTDETNYTSQPQFDNETGDEIVFTPLAATVNEPPVIFKPKPTPKPKIRINGVDVSILVSRDILFDNNGKMVTKNLKDHTREIILGKYTSLHDFLNKWQETDRKEALIAELKEQGVFVDELQAAVEQQVDLFDIICHVAYDQPPLTRKERADNVRKRNYFTKYGTQMKNVLEALLEKYADEGIENLENLEILKVHPLTLLGSPVEILRSFGSRENYLNAVKELESELYRSA